MNDHPFKLAEAECPTCKYKMDAATFARTYVNPNAPKPGDYAVCTCCGELLAFTDDMKLRLMDLNDVLKIKPDDMDDMTHAQRWVRENRLTDENQTKPPVEKRQDRKRVKDL